MIDFLTSSAFQVFSVIAFFTLVIGWGIWQITRHHGIDFKTDARLFDLRHELRVEVEIRKRQAALIGDLEDRVSRLEDQTGKRKRGGAIYDWERQQAITGLLTLQEALREKGYNVMPADVTESLSYILGDDGELRKDNAHE